MATAFLDKPNITTRIMYYAVKPEGVQKSIDAIRGILQGTKYCVEDDEVSQVGRQFEEVVTMSIRNPSRKDTLGKVSIRAPSAEDVYKLIKEGSQVAGCFVRFDLPPRVYDTIFPKFNERGLYLIDPRQVQEEFNRMTSQTSPALEEAVAG